MGGSRFEGARRYVRPTTVEKANSRPAACRGAAPSCEPPPVARHRGELDLLALSRARFVLLGNSVTRHYGFALRDTLNAG